MREDVGIGSANEDGAGDFAGIPAVINAHVKRSGGRADQNVRRRNGSGAEKCVEVGGDRFEGAGRRATIAPTVAGAIVPAGARECGDLLLDRTPGESGGVTSALKDDCGRAFTGTIYVERASTDVDGMADLGKARAVARFAGFFVDDAAGSERDDDDGAARITFREDGGV